MKLWFVTVMSTLALLSLPEDTAAHEVTPTIADLSVTGSVLVLDMRLNIEAFIAGIDLDDIVDTNSSGLSDRYDELRGMAPQDLSGLARDFFESWATQIELRTPDPVDLSLRDILIDAVGDPELPRTSHVVLTGRVPDGASALTLRWPQGAGDLVLRQQGVNEPFTGYVAGGDLTPPIALSGGDARGGWSVFAGYIPVGFDHILPKGLDHILFVLGLFFLSTRLRSLVWQVSAFTVAHTVSLALGATGLVEINPSIVEPLIAASIVYVAVENVLRQGLNRFRPVVIFGFGLLHGLGFASVLGEFGLPDG
jgi:hypothetical protein